MSFIWTENLTTTTIVKSEHFTEIQNNVDSVNNNLVCQSHYGVLHTSHDGTRNGTRNNTIRATHYGTVRATHYGTINNGLNSTIRSTHDGTYNWTRYATMDNTLRWYDRASRYVTYMDINQSARRLVRFDAACTNFGYV